MDRSKEKNKILVVLCKIDNCYEKEDNYRDRAVILPSFFQELNKIKEDMGADKILFSFYTDDTYEHQKLKQTEFAINIRTFANDIILGEQFYEDENHEVVFDSENNPRLCIKNNRDIKEQHMEMLQYIKRLQNTESIVGIFNISNYFEKFNINSMRTIIVSGGLNSIIESLKNRPTYHQLQYTMRN